MLKVDSLGWAVGTVFNVLGLRLGVRSNCPDLDVLRQSFQQFNWPESQSPESDLIVSLRLAQPSKRKGVRNYHLVYAQQAVVTRTMDLKAAWSGCLQAVHGLVLGNTRTVSVLPGVLLRNPVGEIIYLTEADMSGPLTQTGAWSRLDQEQLLLDGEGMIKLYPQLSEQFLPDLIVLPCSHPLQHKSRLEKPIQAGLRLFYMTSNRLTAAPVALAGTGRLTQQVKSIELGGTDPKAWIRAIKRYCKPWA